MGPAPFASNLPIPRQTYSTANTVLSLLARHIVRLARQLLAIPKGWPDEPRQCGCLPDKGAGMRIACNEDTERVIYTRGRFCILKNGDVNFADLP
jgi:hypothetical protein